jgi:hypothetical protein
MNTHDFDTLKNQVAEAKKIIDKVRIFRNNKNTYAKRLTDLYSCCWCGCSFDKYAQKTHEKSKKHLKNVELLTQIINTQ